MTQFAAKTTVTPERSLSEIMATVSRYGASGFLHIQRGDKVFVGFEMRARQVRFALRLPDLGSDEFHLEPNRRRRRTPAAAKSAHDQAVRQQWRALALMIKAKLEAVESGIVEFDQEFMAHIVMPNGQTAADCILPRMRQALAGNPVPLLPDFSNED